MTTSLKELITKFNAITTGSPIVYVTNDIERSFGLEKILQNYILACIDDNQVIDYVKNENIHIFCLERETRQQNQIHRSSAKLLSHPKFQDFLAKMGHDNYIFTSFKPSKQFFEEAGSHKVITAEPELNSKFEEKISQYESLHEVAPFPKTIIGILNELPFEELKKNLSLPFVLQFNRGHTGESTVFIDSQATFSHLQSQFPLRKARCARKAKGSAYTVNACASRYGIYTGGLSLQLTGIPEATAEHAATVGNDWDAPKTLSTEIVAKIQSITIAIGEVMYKNGFKGMFGIDFIVENDNIFVIEVNARQTMSVATYTKFQLRQGQIPLEMLAFAELLDIEFEIGTKEYNALAMQPFPGSQIFIRNLRKDKGVLVSSIVPGVYRLQSDDSAFNWQKSPPLQKDNVIFLDEEKDKPLIFQNNGYSVDDIHNGGMLITAVNKGRKVAYNDEIGRIQLTQSVFNTEGLLQNWVHEIIIGLRDYIVVG